MGLNGRNERNILRCMWKRKKIWKFRKKGEIPGDIGGAAGYLFYETYDIVEGIN